MDLKLNELQRHIIAGIRKKDKVIAARCGWGSGKTSGLVFALWFVSRVRPGCSSLLITDTSPRYRSVLGPEIEKWLGPLGWTFNALESKWTCPLLIRLFGVDRISDQVHERQRITLLKD